MEIVARYRNIGPDGLLLDTRNPDLRGERKVRDP
jgi:hypothetical protein